MTDLSKLLALAQRSPRQVASQDGGAHLALALHCLLINDGFVGISATPSQPYQPEANWNTRFQNEWLFSYRRKGCANEFQLHCSLQTGTGKVFVQAREEGVPSPPPCMGLLLGKYVPDAQLLQQSTWEGALQQLEVLEESFTTYIIQPLLVDAVPAPPEVHVAEGQPGFLSSPQQRLAAGLAVSAVALGALVAAWRYRNH
ncbi:hypothetical protein WJX73_009085 [Symbiochloris irregularis]|uniref:Uncharacterized protein n=1 Tax=Symbiochloris irregularis TaxID=706552 RepID=A0AAW1PYS4_9CHLO